MSKVNSVDVCGLSLFPNPLFGFFNFVSNFYFSVLSQSFFLYVSFLASSSVQGSVNSNKESSTISSSTNATSLMSKALAGFGSASPAKPKSTASPLGAAVVAAAQAQAASEAKQQHSPTAKAVANVVSGRYTMLA